MDTQNNVYDELSDTWLPGGPTYSNSILPTTPLNYVTPDGLSTVTSTANSVTLQSQSPLSLQPGYENSGAYFYESSYTGTNLSIGEQYSEGLQSFTLSAGTGLIVRGTLSASISADVSGVEAAVNALGYEAPYSSGYAGANASFVLASGVQDVLDSQGNYLGFMIQQGNQLDLNLGRDIFADSGTMLDSQSQDFEFTVTNFGSDAMNGVFALNLGVSSYLSVSASPINPYIPPVIDTPDGGDIAPIPEPSTYAMMGLGLVGIAAATRRRRHTA